MKKTFFIVGALLTIAFTYGCNSTASKFAIDESPGIEIDGRLTGDWKMKEDPDKGNFIRVEDYYSKFKNKNARNRYHVQLWDRSGTNASHEFYIFFSDVSKTQFINVPCWWLSDGAGSSGFTLLRVVEISPAHDKLTVVAVSDPVLANTHLRGVASNSAYVKARVAVHLEDPSFFGDTLHFVKVR